MAKQIGFLLAVLLMNVITVNGQDWQTVRSGRIALFDNDQGKIKCIKIDSVRFERDSVLYPMPNIQQIGFDCFLPKGNSWIGNNILIQNNGVNLFFNNEKDTIRIHTLAKIGESWTLFEIKDSLKIIAEVLSNEIHSILGESDSVKTIGFKVYEKNVPKEHHHLSDELLIISKNYGFVRMMNFKVFPKEPNAMTSEILESFDLIGLTNPMRGVQNLTWLEAFDFQVGDELHILYEWIDFDGFRNYQTTRKTKLKYLERMNSKDSVNYRVEREESTFRRIQKWDSTTYVLIHDTIKLVYKPDSLFDKLPGEPIIVESGAYANKMDNDNPVSKTIPFERVILRSNSDECWVMIIYDGCFYNSTYFKGLGGPYYRCTNAFSLGGEENKLVYFKKGSLTWGTPLVITDVKSLEKEDPLKVYPNPASDFVFLENTTGRTENYIIQVIDLQGREVFRNSIELTNNYRLDISSLKEGAYLLKFQNGEKQVSRMIVKKR